MANDETQPWGPDSSTHGGLSTNVLFSTCSQFPLTHVKPSPGHESKPLAYAVGTGRTGPGEGVAMSVHTITHQVHGHEAGTDAEARKDRRTRV